jgi:hypothetical protein
LSQVHTWDGTAGDWFGGAKWDAGVPTGGASVVISGGSVFLTNTTEALASFTLNGGTLSFSNWTTRLIATGIVINAGAVTHVTNLVSTTNNLGQWIPVARVNLECGTLFVQSGGSINANSKGYAGGVNGGNPRGLGPGGGYNAIRAGGGGHGGRGGPGNYFGNELTSGGDVNGIVSAPTNPGSGGAAGSYTSERGGPGGGAILITASGAVTNNGTIMANGGNFAFGTRSGGGSGGSVYITCATIAGSGSIQVRGGNASVNGIEDGGGAGGGGRMAIVYDTDAQSNQPLPQLAFLAGPGSAPVTLKYVPSAEIGTLFFSDTRFLDAVEVFSLSNFQGQLIPGAATNWSSLASLTISNTWIRFPASGFDLTVQGNLTIDATNARLDIGSTAYRAIDLRKTLFNDQPGRSKLDVKGDFNLKKGHFYVFSSATNATVPDYGALVSVTGALVLATNTVVRPISHPENGGAALFRAQTVTVEAGAFVNAEASGYFYDNGPEKGIRNIRPGGGGHGGNGGGGEYIYSWGGKTYGSEGQPVHAGSGGGSYSDAEQGGRGGGVIRIEAVAHVLCNGTLSANGESAVSSGAGGAGGSIQVGCDTFGSTNGIIRANGMNGSVVAGGGGGGRIALRYNTASQALLPLPAATLVAAAGTGLDNGDIGTLYLPDATWLADPITRFTGQLAGLSAFSADTLSVSNCWIRFPANGFVLTVTNQLSIGPNARLDIGGNATLPTTSPSNHFHLYSNGTNPPVLNVGGNLLMTNGASLYVYGGATNSQPVDYGALATIGGSLILNSKSWVYPVSHPTDGGSVLFRMGSLLVATNAGFRADRAGFHSQRGPGKGVVASARCGGAGFGGQGGKGANVSALGGPTYGSSNAPVDCGSGGGSYNTGTGTTADYGGRGGGLIRLVAARNVMLDGTLTANGENIPGTTLSSGGGSGGGIYLYCTRLTGGGKVVADGGYARVAIAGGGGGGRIAIYRVPGEFTGTCSVNGGAGYEAGKAGTIVFVDRRIGTAILIL